MNRSSTGIILQIVKYGETSVITKVLTQDLGTLSFIYKGVRQKKKDPIAHILFPGAILSIDFNYLPHKELHYATKTHIAHPFFIAQESIIKNCIMIFIVEVIKNLVLEAEDNTEIFDIYYEAIEILHNYSDAESANLPIYTLIKMAEISGYKIRDNYSEICTYCDIQNAEFIPSPTGKNEFPFHKHLHHFLSHSTWSEVQNYAMNKDDRKHILELYIKFLQLHHSPFQHFKSLEILSTILS